MAGTLNTVSKLTVDTEDYGRRLLVRGNRIFLATGKTGAEGAVRAFDVNTTTGVLSEVSGPILSNSWTAGSNPNSKYWGLLTSWDLLSQPKTVVSATGASSHFMLTVDLSANNPSTSVIDGDFLQSNIGGSDSTPFTCRADGLVAAKGTQSGFNDGRQLSAGNVVTGSTWLDVALNSGGYPLYLMHPSQAYIHVCREIETPQTGGGAREASVYSFSGTTVPSLYALRLDTTGVGDGASLYTNTFPSTVPLTPTPEAHVPYPDAASLQPWPGHPDHLIAFFNRKTPGTTPELQAWIGFLNVSDPLSWTFEDAVLASGSGGWVLNRNNEVLAHTTWADADGTFAFLRVVEYGVERLLKVHVATGIPHDSWAFASGHYPSQYTSGPAYGLHGEFVTASGWYGTMYRSELHILGKINGAPKKFYFPTHWDAILRTGR